MKKLLFFLLLTSCFPAKIGTVKRPFVVTEIYPVYQEVKMAEYLFKDADGGNHKTYNDTGLFRIHDTILFKELISYPIR